MDRPVPTVSSGSRTSTAPPTPTAKAISMRRSCPRRTSCPPSSSRPRTSSGRIPPPPTYWPYSATPGAAPPTTLSGQFSPVLPDLGMTQQDAAGNAYTTQDWRFTWMITAQQNNTRSGASFDGNIVVFENRPFALDQLTVNGNTVHQAAGENVYEGIFGYSAEHACQPRFRAYSVWICRRGRPDRSHPLERELRGRSYSSRLVTGSPT